MPDSPWLLFLSRLLVLFLARTYSSVFATYSAPYPRGTYRLAETASFGGAVSVSVLRSQFRGRAEPNAIMRGQSRDRARPGTAITYQRREIKYRYADKHPHKRTCPRTISIESNTPFVDRSCIAELFAIARISLWNYISQNWWCVVVFMYINKSNSFKANFVIFQVETDSYVPREIDHDMSKSTQEYVNSNKWQRRSMSQVGTN